VNNYVRFYGKRPENATPLTTDYDVLRKEHRYDSSTLTSRFIRDEEEDLNRWEGKLTSTSHTARLAKKYYDRLYKEYVIVDVSRYQEGKFGFRWRIEKEVFEGKGQFICAAKRCDNREGLESYEVPRELTLIPLQSAAPHHPLHHHSLHPPPPPTTTTDTTTYTPTTTKWLVVFTIFS
jgi:protein FRA10AC1